MKALNGLCCLARNCKRLNESGEKNPADPLYQAGLRPLLVEKFMSQMKYQTRCLSRYTRSKLGFAVKKGTSLYDLVVDALAKDGIKKQDGESSKKFVIKNLEYIRKSAPSKLQSTILAASVRAGKFVEQSKTNPSSPDFLQSFEWRKVRMEALKKYGAKCQCCGATPAHGAVMNVDHIKPRKLFPHLALDLNNLQVLCHDCNHGKGNWDMTDWRERNESPVQLDLRDVSIKVF